MRVVWRPTQGTSFPSGTDAECIEPRSGKVAIDSFGQQAQLKREGMPP
jgi:hypothetical protein